MKRILLSVLLVMLLILIAVPAFAADSEKKIPAPENLTATYTDFEEIKVDWDAAEGANRYIVYRREASATKWTKISYGKKTYFIDKEATDGKTFYYRVRSYRYNSKKKDEYGGYDKTGVKIRSKIPLPKLVSAESAGYQRVEIKWEASAGAERYNVLRKSAGSTKWKTIAKGVEDLSYCDTTAKNGVEYIYSVRGTVYENKTTYLGTYSSKGISVKAVFAAPNGLAAKNTASDKIQVTWKPVEGADGYKVYRKTSATGKWKQIGSTKSTKYTNKVTCGQTYYYTVAGYVLNDNNTVIGERNEAGVKKKAVPATPTLKNLSKEAAVINLQWDKVSDADGYYLYRKVGTSGWKKIADTKKTQYCDGKTELNKKYSYKVKAYRVVDGKKVFGAYSKVVNCKKVPYVHFHQGDDAWGFSRRLERNACVLSCFSMMLKNLGEDANPKIVYAANDDDAGMEFDDALDYFDRKYVSAISESSEYFGGYDAKLGWTYVKEPEKNATAAIREAFDRNPEGVICYFVRGNDMHGVVVIGYDEDNIYYSDPGRVYDKGHNVTFNNTWCKKGHNMGYKHLKLLMAID